MKPSTGHALLGFLSGSLMTLGFGLVAAYATAGLFLHHMFIMGVHSTVGLLFFTCPVLLVLAGAFLALRAFRENTLVPAGRSVFGLLLLLLPLYCLQRFPSLECFWALLA